MHKKVVLSALVPALLLITAVGSRVVPPVSSSTLDVYPGQSIQAAINSAQAGDTIFVHAGTYHEHVEVNNTVSLVGEDQITTIVDGEGTGTVIKVTAENASITGFTIQNAGSTPTENGVSLGGSRNVTIQNNIVQSNYAGIRLQKTNDSTIANNILVSNTFGFLFSSSGNNQITGNTIAYSSTGAQLSGSTIPNQFIHNNFVDNMNQALPFAPTHWNNSEEGNYWSDYTGVDADGDGIGDTPYLLDLDFHPLIIPTRPFPVVVDDMLYPVALISNSTVSLFSFSPQLKQIRYNITGLSGTTGFCNVTIPLTLMWCDQPEEWQITVGGGPPPYFPTPTSNETHTFLYFTYNQNTRNVRITSTYVVPEFPLSMFPPLFIILTLIAIILKRERKAAIKLSAFVA